MSRTYYNHTSKFEIVKEKIVPASTIALQRVGDTFHYGIAICSKFDNFSKKAGREIAENRLNQGFGTLPVPETLLAVPERESCLYMLYNLTKSIIIKNKKWKRDLTRFNETGNRKGVELAKVIELKSSRPGVTLHSETNQSA